MSSKRWSKKVTEGPASLLLPHGIFTWTNPKKIARKSNKFTIEE